MTTRAYSILLNLLFGIFGCRNVGQPKQDIDISALRVKAVEAKQYCKMKNLDQDFYLLIDLNRHSGLKRFYIWDFKRDQIESSFLVSHGCGAQPWGYDLSKESAVVSNVEDSHTSSIGRYIVTNRSYSNWGIHIKYIMIGQDPTNSNAVKRQIVLHSWESVADEEVYPAGTPEGWGCPAVSNNSMLVIDRKLKSTNKEVLLWIIKS